MGSVAHGLRGRVRNRDEDRADLGVAFVATTVAVELRSLLGPGTVPAQQTRNGPSQKSWASGQALGRSGSPTVRRIFTLLLLQSRCLGGGDACPVFPGKRYQDWELPDPAGLSLEDVRPIRDEIEQRVRTLLDELQITHR